MKTTNPGDPSQQARKRHWLSFGQFRSCGRLVKRYTIAAAVIWIGAWVIYSAGFKTPLRLILTGANARLTSELPDAGMLDVGPHSRVRVDDKGRVAYADRGEMTFDVRGPYVIETPVSRATVRVRAKVRVLVSASVVALEVLDGVVEVHGRGTARQLKKGDPYPYRVPRAALASLVAERGDRESVRMEGSDSHGGGGSWVPSSLAHASIVLSWLSSTRCGARLPRTHICDFTAAAMPVR
jgi:hypothetical protein